MHTDTHTIYNMHICSNIYKNDFRKILIYIFCDSLLLLPEGVGEFSACLFVYKINSKEKTSLDKHSRDVFQCSFTMYLAICP